MHCQINREVLAIKGPLTQLHFFVFISEALPEEEEDNLRHVTLKVTFELIICEMLQGSIKVE